MQTQTNEKKSGQKTSGNLQEQCLNNCQESMIVCLEALNFCLEQGGEHVEKTHIKTLQSCAIACRTAVEMMALQSDFSSSFCQACAETCRACAESCENMDGEMMKRCADACRESQETCEKMAQAH